MKKVNITTATKTNRLTDIENRLVVGSGETEEGRGKMIAGGLRSTNY